jgi:hypothetical protein
VQQSKSISKAFAVNLETLVEHLGRIALLLNVQLTKDLIDLYMLALQDLAPDQLATGFARVVRECTFFPVPAELRELCTGIPSRSSASNPINNEVNKYWAWLIKWTPMLSKGYRYDLTVEPFGKRPVSYKSTGFSLDCRVGTRPYCRLKVEMPPRI